MKVFLRATLAVVLIASPLTALQLATSSSSASAAPATSAVATWNADPNADLTATWTKNTGSASYYTYVNDFPDSAGSTYLTGPNLTNTNNALVFDTVNTPTNYAGVSSITVNAYLKLSTSGATGGTDTQTVVPTITNSSGTTLIGTPTGQSITATTLTQYTWTLYPKTNDFSATTWNGMRMGISSTYAAVGGADTTSALVVSSLNTSIQYAKSAGSITQQGYIFENDDGAGTPDNNSAQAAGNTAITGVQAGERVNLRTQDLAATNAETANAGLFYDRGDGYWTKVKSSTTANTSTGTCADVNFNCSDIDTSMSASDTTSTAVDSAGKPWISYADTSATANHLKIATYVGTGGTGCATTAWTCIALTAGTGNGEGLYNSIAIDNNNNVWVSYYDQANSRLMVAENVAGTGCAVSTWTCTVVKTSVNMQSISIDDATTIAIGPGGAPSIAYENTTGGSIYLAQYVGAGGDCTSAAWNGCATLIDNGDTGYPTVGFSPSGVAWMAWESANSLEVAHFVGGTSGTNCGSSAWTCDAVGTSPQNDSFPSIAFAPDGNPWISYRNSTVSALKVAKYLGGATTGTGCALTTYTCTTVDSAGGNTGYHTSISFDPSGKAWVTYYDKTNGDLKLSRYVGSGGNCTDTAWKCTTIQSAADTGDDSSLAFAPDGTAWISSGNNTTGALRVSSLNRGGEIRPSASLGAPVNGSAITKSHSDMTSVTDTTNQGDADCISGTWTNGLTTQTDEVTGLNIPASNCTELMFSLDTSQAQDNTTYRFVTSFADPNVGARSYWRGPLTVSQLPSLTTASATTTRYSKDAIADDASCTDTTWSCTDVDAADSVGLVQSMAFSPNGTPWILYEDATTRAMNYTVYVGSGGTGCNSSQWTCGVVDTTTYTNGTSAQFAGASQAQLKFAPDGTLWASWTGTTGTTVAASITTLRTAKFVGTGGTGCGTATAWTCTTVETYNAAGAANATGFNPSMALDKTGTPWISYFDDKTWYLKLTHFVGSGGTGCTGTTAWTCVNVQAGILTSTWSSGGSGASALLFDASGAPQIAYATRYTNNNALKFARYVGGGGTCTNPQWSCQSIDGGGTSAVGFFVQAAVDSTGTIWIAYQDNTGTAQKIARYLNGGSSATCTTATDWSCESIAFSAAGYGRYGVIAIDGQGNPWVLMKNDNGNTRDLARYVGGTSGNCNGTGSTPATDWQCTGIVQSTSSSWASLAFDKSGIPWFADYGQTGADLYVGHLHLPATPPTISSTGNTGFGSSNAQSGDLRYHLDAGLSGRPSTCAAASNMQGYCGVSSANSTYDQISAIANQTPLYDFATKVSSNSSYPSFVWTGKSTVGGSSSATHIQVFDFTTNTWNDITTNTTAAANASFTLVGTVAAYSASDYYQSAGGGTYWVDYRVYQPSNASAQTLSTDYFGLNRPPTTPINLGQYKSDNTTVIPTGGYTNETVADFHGDATDPDGDNLTLCAEVASTLTSPNNPGNCGINYASGTSPIYTSTYGLTDGTTYKWQLKSRDANYTFSNSYAQFNGGSNAFTVDLTAPTAVAVYDGSSAGVDANFNSGSLSSLSCNWAASTDAVSGVGHYEYSIGTTNYATSMYSGTNTLGWTSVAAGTTSATATGLNLVTNQPYFCNVRVFDIAGNVSAITSSDGQVVAPTLTFAISSNSVNFANLNASNSYSDSKVISLTTSSNAYRGYVIQTYEASPLISGAQTISDYASGAGSPTVWSGTGFGYNVAGGASASAFSGSKYAHFGAAGSPDTPVTHSATVSGTPIGSEVETMTLKVATNSSQLAGAYKTSLVFSCTATY